MMKAQFEFTLVEKIAMLEVLAKYKDAPPHHQEITQSLKLDGSTILWPDEARYLTGVVRPFYSFGWKAIQRYNPKTSAYYEPPVR